MRLVMPAMLLGLWLPSNVAAQEWASRFPRAPECQLQYTRAVQPGSSGLASLTIRPIFVGRGTVVEQIRVLLKPLDTDTRPPARSLGPIGTRDRLPGFDSLPAGRYQLTVGAVGLARSPDTLVIHPGSSDTVTVNLFADLSHFHNEHNCRPRGFRRAGERACVTDTAAVNFWADHMRTFADTTTPRWPNLIPFRESEILVVRDEKICDQAGRAYGGPNSPPRRVIVLRLGRMYFVYDPFEPVTAGEFRILSFFDLQWKNLFNVTS